MTVAHTDGLGGQPESPSAWRLPGGEPPHGPVCRITPPTCSRQFVGPRARAARAAPALGKPATWVLSRPTRHKLGCVGAPGDERLCW